MSEVIYTINIDKYCECGYHFNINGKSEKEVVKEYLAMKKQHDNTEQHKEWVIRNTYLTFNACAKCSCGKVFSERETHVGFLSDEDKRLLEKRLGHQAIRQKNRCKETKQHKRILKMKRIII